MDWCQGVIDSSQLGGEALKQRSRVAIGGGRGDVGLETGHAGR